MFVPKITKEELNEMPVACFEGEITVVDDTAKAEAAIGELRRHTIVGIDTETKPSFVKGKVNKVSLLQISTPERCFLFRLNMIDFPPSLEAFLTDRKIKKIGLAMHDDMNGLNRHHKFKPANTIDIQVIAKNYGILELGLQKIYAIVFGEKISKSQQLSNWENKQLTGLQQRYAATDAWACLRIFQKLQQEIPLSSGTIEQLILEHTVK